MSGAADKTNELCDIVNQLDNAYVNLQNMRNLLDVANSEVLSLHAQLDGKYSELKAAFETPAPPVPEPVTEVPQVPFPEPILPNDQQAHY